MPHGPQIPLEHSPRVNLGSLRFQEQDRGLTSKMNRLYSVHHEVQQT